jgi:hypothetical protein
MPSPMKAGGTAIAVVALSLALGGCGSDTKSAPSSSSSSSSSSSESSSSKSSAPSTPAQAGKNETIADYIKESGITETPVKRGEAGTPAIYLPIPAGWADAGAKTPPYAYAAIVSTDPTMAADPPSIVALMSKLTGDVDPAKILEYAPGELKNLPGFEGGDGDKRTLGGFDAYQIGGSYVKDGAKRMIAQKTVVIPGQGGVFVLQLNADGLEDQMGPLMDATSEIDEKTTITP